MINKQIPDEIEAVSFWRMVAPIIVMILIVLALCGAVAIFRVVTK